MNWYNHQNEARRRGGNLTTIINKKEYDEVRRVSRYRRIFIGAIRRYRYWWLNWNRSFYLGWRWISNSREYRRYYKFAGGEPNNWGNIEPVLELYSNGYYNDIPWWVGRPAVYKIQNSDYTTRRNKLNNERSSFSTEKISFRTNRELVVQKKKKKKKKTIKFRNSKIKKQ